MHYGRLRCANRPYKFMECLRMAGRNALRQCDGELQDGDVLRTITPR